MSNMLQMILAAMFSLLWANPTWIKLTPAPIDLTPQKTVLVGSKPLKADDDYAHVQVDLGKNTPQISEAILHGTFDKDAARAVHVQVCRSDDDCVELQFKGLSFSHEYYDAGYFIPSTVKSGTVFKTVRIWSENPMRGVIVHWVSGDTG